MQTEHAEADGDSPETIPPLQLHFSGFFPLPLSARGTGLVALFTGISDGEGRFDPQELLAITCLPAPSLSIMPKLASYAPPSGEVLRYAFAPASPLDLVGLLPAALAHHRPKLQERAACDPQRSRRVLISGVVDFMDRDWTFNPVLTTPSIEYASYGGEPEFVAGLPMPHGRAQPFRRGT